DIDAAGSGTAFEDLAKGECDLGMASRPVSSAEADRIAEAQHGDMRLPGNENVIGLDGIAVIVNTNNPTRTLSIDRVVCIFDGEETAWLEDSVVTGPIHVYARDDRSGTYDSFRSFCLGDRSLVAGAKRFADSDALAAAV